MKDLKFLSSVVYWLKFMLCACLCLPLIFTMGCAAGLTSAQKREFVAYQSRGLAMEEKNPGAAAAFGLLPGGGSFYTRQYGLGVIDLLFWPLSILWDPINGYMGAETTNYYSTKEDVRIKMEKETSQLDDDLEDGKLTEKEYLLEKRKIRQKFSID